MSMRVHDAVSLQLGSIQNVALATASATSSSALPTSSNGFRIVAGCDIWIHWLTASASAGNSIFVPAKVPEYFEANGGAVIDVLAATSANPMTAQITPFII